MEINKRSLKKPRFELCRVRSDGSEKIGLYSLRRIIEQADEINMGRRDFLSLTALVGSTALIASCTAIPPSDLTHEVIKTNNNDAELIVAQYLDKNIHAHIDEVKSICFDPSGKILVSGSNDSTIKLWDVVSNEVATRKLLKHFCSDLRCSATGCLPHEMSFAGSCCHGQAYTGP